MLGASVYLSEDVEKNLKYIDFLHGQGVQMLFTSLHIPEDDTSKTLDHLRKITDKIESYKINLMIDVSSDTFKTYGIRKENAKTFFKEMGVSHLRLDYGFTFEEMNDLSKDFQIVLNASTVDEEVCNGLEEVGFSFEEILVCHNFYPRENTGLSKEFLKKKNKFLKKKGFQIAAFIPGDNEKRGPIFESLPTIEDHRYLNPLESYLDLTNHYYVDDVLIGDISMTEESLRKLLKWQNESIITLEVICITNDLPQNFYTIHQNRKDYAQDVVRSAASRIDLKDKNIAPSNTINRPEGTVTLDNILYGRYSGELQITKTNLEQDDRVNVLGRVIASDLGLLKYIKSHTKFKFRR